MFQYELSTMNIVQRSSMSQSENTNRHTDQLLCNGARANC